MNKKEGKHSAAFHKRLRDWWEKPEAPMEARPMISHLNALRRTLFICVAAVSAAFLVVFLAFSKELVGMVTEPLARQGVQVIFTGVSEAFTAQTKLSLIVGGVIASPVVFGAVWMFIAPGLHRRERICTALLVGVAAFLFGLGVFFAYRYVFFLAVNFFVIAGEGIASPMLSLGTYVNFLFGFLLPFGFMFELPVLVAGLARMGLVTARGLSKSRKYIVFFIAIAAAVLTPPDVVSQVMLGVPMWLLFETGVICARLLEPRDSKGRQVSDGAVKA